MSRKNYSNATTSVTLHTVINGAMSSGAATFALTPSGIGGRLATLADAWGLFRVRKLKFRQHRQAALAGALQVATVVSDFVDAYPSTFQSACEMGPAAVISALQTVPSDWVEVPPAVLRGALPWYKAVAGAPDSWDEVPVTFVIVGTGTDTFYLELKLVVDFKDPLPAGSTPMMRELAKSKREREHILQVLSVTNTTKTGQDRGFDPNSLVGGSRLGKN